LITTKTGIPNHKSAEVTRFPFNQRCKIGHSSCAYAILSAIMLLPGKFLDGIFGLLEEMAS
jgi:hypothetical protein